MDRRSWPWKKKSSDKAAVEKADAAVPSAPTASQSDQGKQDNYKKPNYVQISMESYTHLSGLEDHVKSCDEQLKTLEDEVKELNEKLLTAQSEITTKENLVKQHSKVAEEAVSGWEKAEAEASALKNQLESVMLLKLTAEDRASHLNGALKECMRQIRNLKEEHEHNLHEVVLNETKQWEKIKIVLEAKIADLDQELLRSAAENAALSRSLQERSNMLVKISEEKSQAEAEIELLKSNIESCEKEINSLKYELHIASKELEIRNEEKNMSVRSAEIANKQHLEGVKKIAKLEAECQRLRGLVRKKLPGPAALAQMKLEVENLGRDSGEPRYRRSPGKPPSPHLSPLPEFSLEGVQKYHKENELLAERLLAMEEETKMLKEALAKRNSELQASRNICAKTVSKIQNLEVQLQANGDLRKSNVQIHTDCSFSPCASNPPSLTSMSEDGNDDEVSYAGSWSTTYISEISHFKKEKNTESPTKVENANRLELMDDFLEMEKLAELSNDSNCTISTLNVPNHVSETASHNTPVEVINDTAFPSRLHSELNLLQNQQFTEGKLEANPQPDEDLAPLRKLRSRIDMIFESMPKDGDMDNVLENIKHVVHDMYDGLQKQPIGYVAEAMPSSDAPHDSLPYLKDTDIVTEKEISLSEDINQGAKTMDTINQELVAPLMQIRDFVLFLENEAKTVQGYSGDGNKLICKLKEFFMTFDQVIHGRNSLIDFVHGLSHVLAKASELRFSMLGFKNTEAENAISDCIDKVALPENKGSRDSLDEQYPTACADLSYSASDPDVLHGGNFIPPFGDKATSWKCLQEQFEQIKLEKQNLAMDLERCTENLEITKSQLHETEQLLAEVKSELTSAKKLNSLAETQLKCMAESYKTLEARAEELQAEVNLLRVKTDNLDEELLKEKRNHQDALSICKELQNEMQRIGSSLPADNDTKPNQERELAAAADKLAECQEVILLLGKQLKSFRPQTDAMGSPHSESSLKGEGMTEEEPTISGTNLEDIDQAEMDTAISTNLQRPGAESPVDLHNASCPSDSEANTLRSAIGGEQSKHQHMRSSSSSSSSGPTPEKHTRGFSRFFSSKGKTGSQ